MLIRFTYTLIGGYKVVGEWLDASKISIAEMEIQQLKFKAFDSKFEVEYKEGSKDA